MQSPNIPVLVLPSAKYIKDLKSIKSLVMIDWYKVGWEISDKSGPINP